MVFGHGGPFDPAVDLSALDGTSGFRLDGIASQDFAGYAVSRAGDVNGDGIDDLIVGAKFAEAGGTVDRGEAYVVFGHADPSVALSALGATNGFKLNGIYDGGHAGISVSSAGDLNGDGFDDLIVGAHWANSLGIDRGESYVVYGKAGGFDAAIDLSALDGANGFKLVDAAFEDNSGRAVTTVGDFNGDGFDDLVIGAPLASPNGFFSGETFVLFSGDFTSSVTFLGTAGGDNFAGTAAGERFVGSRGDDLLTGNGGADVFEGGAVTT